MIMAVYGDLQRANNRASSGLQRPVWMSSSMGIPVRMMLMCRSAWLRWFQEWSYFNHWRPWGCLQCGLSPMKCTYQLMMMAHSPSSIITRSGWLLPSLSCFKWDLLSPHCIASMDISSLLILWPCCLWFDLHILWCLNLNVWRIEYGWEWILFVCDDVPLLK